MPVFFSQSKKQVKEYSYYQPLYGNYQFDLDLTYFGIMKERKFRKVNRFKNLLRLRDSNNDKSIYPMLDEYGYSFYDFFIFKSTWDYEYSIETSNTLTVIDESNLDITNLGKSK
jgi:hypothetical protein